jgi:hypothetical protein
MVSNLLKIILIINTEGFNEDILIEFLDVCSSDTFRDCKFGTTIKSYSFNKLLNIFFIPFFDRFNAFLSHHKEMVEAGSDLCNMFKFLQVYALDFLIFGWNQIDVMNILQSR